MSSIPLEWNSRTPPTHALFPLDEQPWTSCGSQNPPLTSSFNFPLPLGFFVRVHRKNIRTGMLWRVRRSSGTSLVVVTWDIALHNRLAHRGRVIQGTECLCDATRICQPSRQHVDAVRGIRAKQDPVSHCLQRVCEPVHDIHPLSAAPNCPLSVKEMPTPVHWCFVPSTSTKLPRTCRTSATVVPNLRISRENCAHVH